MENYENQSFRAKLETFEPMIDPEEQEIARDQVDVAVQNIPMSIIKVHTGTIPKNNSLPVQEQQSPESQNIHLPENMQQNISLTPVRLPAILDGEFYVVTKIEDSNVTVRCLQCQKLLSGNLKSTGNFLSHIKRVHPLLMEKIKCKSNQRRPALIYVDFANNNKTEQSNNTKPKCVRYEVPNASHNKLATNKDDVNSVEDCQSRSEENFEASVEWLENPKKKQRKIEETDSNESFQNHCANHFMRQEDEFDAIGRNVAVKLRNMRLDQRIVAEKLINDVLFEGQLGNLHRDCNLHI